MLTDQDRPRIPAARHTAILLRWVMLFGLCGGFQSCALWGPSPPDTGGQAVDTSPKRVLRPETHRFAIAKEQGLVGLLMTLPLDEDDTLPDVARHYGLGYEELAAANPDIDPWVPKSGSKALVPIQFVLPHAQRRGIVINLAAMRLFHFPAAAAGGEVVTYPVGIGKEGRSTPTGPLSIIRKKEHPTWYPTANIRADHARKGDPLPAAVSPGPDNPLGDFAMYLSRQPYLIHGTNKPYSIGWRASNGCIRLYPENIDQLFPAVPLRERVLIVNQPYLYGWRDELLYLQAFRPQEELNEAALRKRVRGELKKLEADKGHPLDWARIDRVLAEARGVPIPVSAQGPEIEVHLARALPLEHPRRFLGEPEIPGADPERWTVLVDESVSEATALRLAAFLNHQGPQIPARTETRDGRFRVVAGPYPTAKEARMAVKRLKIELELDGTVVAPAAEVAGVGGSAGKSAPAADRKPSSGDRQQAKRQPAAAASAPLDSCSIPRTARRTC